MFKHQKGISTLVLVIIIAVVTLVLAGLIIGGYMTWRYFDEKEESSRRKSGEDSDKDDEDSSIIIDNKNKVEDTFIKSNMTMLRVAAEMIYEYEGYDYNNFNCQHKDVKQFCDDAKKYADMEPVIHTSKDEYCAWIKLNSKENGKTKYMCIDDMGHLNEVTTDPGQRGFCDGISFVCPSDEW